MKEASGELSMTAVAVVAIAAVGVLFTTLIWPSIKGQLLGSAKCSSAFNCTNGANDTTGTCTNQKCYCNYYDNDGNVAAGKVQCPNPDSTTTKPATK